MSRYLPTSRIISLIYLNKNRAALPSSLLLKSHKSGYPFNSETPNQHGHYIIPAVEREGHPVVEKDSI